MEAPQVVLFLPGAGLGLTPLFLLEQDNGALEPFGCGRVRRCMLAKQVGIAPQPAPAD